ncbi:hypothetical protein ACIBFB_06230 [Nocardiopsis sp. NPDC050513]|uniref:hypothetical protein n=1 Tax=Nocardiopsis sp. NPDC050513 TaxID=3364338 RepID=UPI003793A4AC
MLRGFVLPAFGLVLMSGCSVEDSTGAEPVVQSSTTPVETEPSEATPEDEAIAAYLRFWDAIVLASEEMDPDHPELAEHATGQALELAQFGVQGLVDEGHGMEGELDPSPEVVSAEPEDDPTTVEIDDCQVGGDWRAAGAEEPEMDRVLVTATVKRDVFDWWVVEMRIWGDDTC